MGASTSTEQKVPNKQKEVENEAASLGSLPILQSSFSKLADPLTNLIPFHSLARCFSLEFKEAVFDSGEATSGELLPDPFLGLLNYVGPSVVELFFEAEPGGVGWIEFVRGYLRCCGRVAASVSLSVLLRVFALAAERAGISVKLEMESSVDDDDNHDDLSDQHSGYKLGGSIRARDVHMLLLMCWSMVWESFGSDYLEMNRVLFLPDINSLVLSAVVSCAEEAEGGSGLDLWDCNVSGLDVGLAVGKFLSWVLATVPCLTECFTQFVNARIRCSVAAEGASASTSSQGHISSAKAHNSYILTSGRAWAISLACRNAINDGILKPFLPGDSNQEDQNLLYRSSSHGRGMNRFWSNVDGYHGPLLVLISAALVETEGNSGNGRRWIIGALTEKGLENRDVFYGSSGTLYSIHPSFHVFSPTGKEKNFVYSHLHPVGRVYEPRPKPVGLAFGGSIGNERIFIDEDFSRVTVRHHAVDKTYQSGSLFPHQGFLPAEAVISEVEVWGLGGKTSREVQASYRKREDLFIEQRRKVDMKTFASWDDSPEKMMMDMMGDPNKVAREDR